MNREINPDVPVWAILGIAFFGAGVGYALASVRKTAPSPQKDTTKSPDASLPGTPVANVTELTEQEAIDNVAGRSFIQTGRPYVLIIRCQGLPDPVPEIRKIAAAYDVDLYATPPLDSVSTTFACKPGDIALAMAVRSAHSELPVRNVQVVDPTQAEGHLSSTDAVVPLFEFAARKRYLPHSTVAPDDFAP